MDKMRHEAWQERAAELWASTTLTVREIADAVGAPKSTVHDYLQKYVGPRTGARILVFDIETTPGVAYFWSRWDKFIPQQRVIDRPGKVLTWSAKWLGAEEVMNDASINYGDAMDDFGVVESIWQLLDKADIVVAHNGDKFDIKKLNNRFAFHGMGLPSPYRSVDTLKIAKRKFGMDSNSLDAIGDYFGLGRKVEHSGFDLWLRCMAGEQSAFNEMLEYNDQDVLLLEQVYLLMRPYDHLHPSVAVIGKNDEVECSKCGSPDLEVPDKFYRTQVNEYQLLRCKGCGGWNRRRVGSKTTAQGRNIVVPAK